MTTKKYPRIVDVGRGGAGVAAKMVSDDVLLYRNIPYRKLTWHIYLRTARKNAADIVRPAVAVDFGPGGIGNKKGGRALRYAVFAKMSTDMIERIRPQTVRARVLRSMGKRKRG